MKPFASFNDRVADRITTGLSSMWTAYVFTIVALVSLPAALATHSLIVIVAWFAQTFVQLVALSILGAGQDKAAKWTAAELRETHDAAMEEIGLLREDHAAMAGLVEELHQFHIEGKLPDRITKA